jgi:hypothetical protein
MTERLSESEIKVKNVIFKKKGAWYKSGIKSADNSMFNHIEIQNFLQLEKTIDSYRFDVELENTLLKEGLYYKRDEKDNHIYLPEEEWKEN